MVITLHLNLPYLTSDLEHTFYFLIWKGTLSALIQPVLPQREGVLKKRREEGGGEEGRRGEG